MASANPHKPNLNVGALALAALLFLSLSACAIKESTDVGVDGGVVISVSDTSSVHLDLDQIEPMTFSDSGEFNLDEIRARISDKGINSDSVRITGLSVTYDDSTKGFLDANKGVHFILEIYTRENDTAAEKLTLETGNSVGDFAPLAFDPDMVLFELNKQIFGNEAGFPGVLTAIKDESKHSLHFIAKLTVVDKLKTVGIIKLKLVVTVAGKV